MFKSYLNKMKNNQIEETEETTERMSSNGLNKVGIVTISLLMLSKCKLINQPYFPWNDKKTMVSW